MKTLNPFTIGLLIVIGLGITQESFGQCTDVPTTPEMGVYNTFRLDFDYRYAPGISSLNTRIYTFYILQWYGCCSLSGNCDIAITTAYGTPPTEDYQSADGMVADYIFTAKGKYVVGASHPGFSNCSGGTSIRLLNFFLTDNDNDLDADDIINEYDCNIDGDYLNNDEDENDDNDDKLDYEDDSPGGKGTRRDTYPSDWGENCSGPPASGTPTQYIPYPTSTPTLQIPTPTPLKTWWLSVAKHPDSLYTKSSLNGYVNSGNSRIKRDDGDTGLPYYEQDYPANAEIRLSSTLVIPTIFVKDDNYANIDSSTEEQYVFNYMHSAGKDCFCVPQLYSGFGNGMANSIPGDRIIIADTASDKGSIIHHEWGHCLGLQHPCNWPCTTNETRWW